MGLIASTKKALWKPATIAVLLLVLGWNYAFSFESVKEQLPFLVTAQLLFHQALSHLIPAHSCHLLTIVEIDDDAFTSAPISSSSPTNRSYLGTLIRNAAEADAATIAMPFDLPSGVGVKDRPPGNDPAPHHAQ